MGMMIGIALEEKWASAAVVRNAGQNSAGKPGSNSENAALSLGNIHPEKICDSDGDYLFEHKGALKNYKACVHVLEKIRNRAQIFCGSAVDCAIISIPSDLNLIYWGMIKEAAKEAGFAWIRPMTRSMAEAIYIANAVPLKRKTFAMIMQTGSAYETSFCKMEEGVLGNNEINICTNTRRDDLFKILRSDAEMAEQEYSRSKKKNDRLKTVYFTGNMTEKVYNSVLEALGGDAVIQYVKNECACGAAVYSVKLTGEGLDNFLVMDGIPFLLSLKMNDEEILDSFGKCIIPASQSEIVNYKAENFARQRLLLLSSDRNGRYTAAGEFDLTEFFYSKKDSLEFSIGIDSDFDITLSTAALETKPNGVKVKGREVKFSLFDKNRNRLLLDLIKDTNGHGMAESEDREEDGENADSLDGADKVNNKAVSMENADNVLEMIMKLLPVIDDLEKSIGYADSHSEQGVADGLRMVEKKLFAVMAEYGVKPIEAVGQEFSIDYHSAVSHVKDIRYKENVVIREVQKGYLHNGKVLRYSKVVVAN